MTSLPDLRALRARFEQQERASAGGPRVAFETAFVAALEAIGWRSAGDDAVAMVATDAESIVDACVHGHGDVARAARDLAALMRRFAPRHSDFLDATEAFIPAAEEVLRRYAAGERASDRPHPPF